MEKALVWQFILIDKKSAMLTWPPTETDWLIFIIIILKLTVDSFILSSL